MSGHIRLIENFCDKAVDIAYARGVPVKEKSVKNFASSDVGKGHECHETGNRQIFLLICASAKMQSPFEFG